MSSFKNSRFGKRLQAFHKVRDEKSPRKKRRRTDDSPTKNPAKRMKTLSGAAMDITNTPTKRKKIRYLADTGDRFVPSRDQNSIQASYSLEENSDKAIPFATPARWYTDPEKDQANVLFKSVLRAELASTPSPTGRIIAYHSPAKFQADKLPECLDNPLDHSYQVSPLQQETRMLMNQPRPLVRKVPNSPYRVLDAPDLEDDFYTNLLDWSPSGVLAVGLRQGIYFWKADGCKVERLPTSPRNRYYSLAWMQTSPTIAVGTADGDLELYDVSTLQRVRKYINVHDGRRIGVLSWTGSTLSSGSRDYSINHWDIRDSSVKPFKRSLGHTQEVCGLKWNSDNGIHSSMLASGGNDGRVCVWDLKASMRDPESRLGSSSIARHSSSASCGTDGPLFKFYKTKAAVRALAWNPHVSAVLASGSGSQDRCLRFWNTSVGTMLDEINTGSQVCSLLWSKNTHELVSTHGYGLPTTANQICIWKYPTKRVVTSLVGHTHRVQYVALSPKGDTIVTGSGDQTLRFWNVFPDRLPHSANEGSVLDYGKLIR
ncbi:hypothetical protein GYMLUDRAFT_46451 [Collybiopsis luxurians FD-317 M1]|uniref:CDC20/Fizzy WD40 domain-containing protein n=1 Tax=Collybiopsis luxurians FD-317 M1 TaxID=944289 RepID=A0A0D0C444_9AGAR|nr:hypothetical protein GYMLUDRAFT_46451 [Collybiopsis luxurians FD-317 M1]